MENLIKAFALMNLLSFIPNKDHQTTIFHQKCVKICFKLLRTYLTVFKETNNEAAIFSILEKIYKLLKRDNLIVLQFLNGSDIL